VPAPEQINNSTATIDVTGWILRDRSGRAWAVSLLGQISAGSTASIKRGGMAMSLDNGGDEVEFLNGLGDVFDRIIYGATTQVLELRPLV
jgi:hypothetical protein